MTARPVTVLLSPPLARVQERWLALPRTQQDELYAAEFAPAFAPLFAGLPLHGAPPGFERPRALVSVLGFSWQPVALMAAWARPEQMLVIGTKESLTLKVAGEGVLTLIGRLSGIERDRVQAIEAGDPGEADIYRAVRDFLRSAGVAARQVFIDPTGGKKSMSSSAALAGFLVGAPLVYVDYSEYHGPNRIPVAGTEYPRLLANPLEVLGDLELRDIFAAFNRGDFLEARHLAEKLAVRLYEPREAECLALLASAYGAWDRFDFITAGRVLAEALRQIERFSARGGWGWAPTALEAVEANKRALEALVAARKTDKPSSMDEGRVLLAWYLAAASRHLESERPSLAVLLIYAAVERYVDLCLWVDFKLDDEAPDYGRVEGIIDRQRYDEAGRRLFGKAYRPRDVGGPLMFGNGAQLLAALKPDRLQPADLGVLAGLSNARNKCEYEHGFLPRTPEPDDVRRHLDRARAIIASAFDEEKHLDECIAACQFPVLPGRS
jgi:CRISPR-associated protein (TIGR02710 family)